LVSNAAIPGEIYIFNSYQYLTISFLKHAAIMKPPSSQSESLLAIVILSTASSLRFANSHFSLMISNASQTAKGLWDCFPIASRRSSACGPHKYLQLIT